jgi:hypothetical protein
MKIAYAKYTGAILYFQNVMGDNAIGALDALD